MKLRFFKTSYKDNIRKALPKVRGRLLENVRFDRISWFGVGGPADFLFEPKDKEDLVTFVQGLGYVPTVLLGGCSNVLIRDGGIMGCVIRLGREFSGIEVDGDRIECGCGTKNIDIAKAALDNGIGGFEFLHDIPGTIGGALRSNAGAHGFEVGGVVTAVEACNSAGQLFDLENADMGFSYRHTGASSEWLFVNVSLQGYAADREEIQAKIKEYREYRKKSQPMGVKTAGSTFKNPPGMKAWELIDKSGCRGMRIGGAMVSEKNCNFLINTGNATAADLENLGDTVQEKVLLKQGILLEWEVKRIGVKQREDD